MISYRKRLLASTVTTIVGGIAMIAPQAASAQCAVAPGTVTCATTTTTNTTNAGGTPASDRNYVVNTSAAAFTGTVSAGAVVDGRGLAFTNTVGGINALNVVNNGTVQINPGNLATAGGGAVIEVTAIGATPVNYSGTGNLINLGVPGNGLTMNMNGTGALVATVGGNATSSVDGIGLVVIGNGASGNLALTTTAGRTITADFIGVQMFVSTSGSTSTVSLNNNAAVVGLVANGLDIGVIGETIGIGAVSVANTGMIGSSTDRINNTGIYAGIGNAASTAALSLTGNGAVFSSGTAVVALNEGLGTTTVNYTGAVNTTGVTGVEVDVTSGETTVTLGAVTAATNSVDVDSTTGTQTINLNGVTTGTTGSGLVSTTSGLRFISVGTGGNVIGGTQAILLAGTGGGTLVIGGIVGSTSAGLAINSASVTGPLTTGTLAGSTLNGRLTLGSGVDSFQNIGTFNTQGTSDFGVGVDSLTNNGTLNTTAATTLLGLEGVLNTGTLNANFGLTFDSGVTAFTNTGTLNSAGTIDFGAGADSFANNGAGIFNLTASTTLAALETFTQSGRINLNANTLTLSGTAFTNAGTIDTSGSAAIANVTSFNNGGILDLAPGTFTVPLVAFTNSGTILADEGASTINGQASFANTGTIDLQDGVTGDVLTINSSYVGSGGSNLLVDFDDTTADRLIVGAASGTTSVNATYVGLGLLNVPGILVVDTASTTANAFVLGTVGGNTSPLVDYSLLQIGSDFFLSAAPDPSAFDPVAISNMAGSLWYQTADEVTAQTDLPSVSDGFGFWGQIYYSQDKMGDDDEVAFIDGTAFAVDNELKTDRYGIQAGIDYGFGGARIGLTGGYGVAKADNDLNSELKAKGWNIGLYGAFGGLTGFHGSALIKHDRYDLEFESGAFEGAEADLRSTGVDGSLGYRFGLGGDATLDAKIGLAHVKTKIDDITAFGFNYDIGKVTSTRGRAGVRAAFGGSLSPYIEAMVLREFKGDGDIELFDGATFYDIESDGKGTWFRLEAGLAPQLGSGPILAAWADLGDKKGFGLRAGFRFGGRAVEEVLPPPPPPMVEPAPPPPPPATQTCSDGSVILATDACPPPPPPPPPAPEPERG